MDDHRRRLTVGLGSPSTDRDPVPTAEERAAMSSDAFADLTRLQEQEERVVEAMEEHRRQVATLQALLGDARRREHGTGRIGAQVRVADEEVGLAERDIAALRERIVAAEKALPADLRDEEA
jgi:hypothetical protein